MKIKRITLVFIILVLFITLSYSFEASASNNIKPKYNFALNNYKVLNNINYKDLTYNKKPINTNFIFEDNDQIPKVQISVSMPIANKNFSVEVQGEDDNGLEKIRVLLSDGWHNHNCNNEETCSYEWTTSESKEGEYTYKAMAIDNAKKVALRSTTIKIDSVCEESWVKHEAECNKNDQTKIYYTDENECIIPKNKPADETGKCDYCKPDISEQKGECIKDEQIINYVDKNNCYSTTSLDSDKAPEPKKEACDSCTPDFKEEYTQCILSDTKTKYYSDQNNCYEKTALDSDKPQSNETVQCDYCTPSWQEHSTSCGINDSMTTYYADANNCYSLTKLQSDNNPLQNQTKTCDYCAPNIQSTVGNCLLNDTKIKTYNDSNNCYSKTGLTTDKIPADEASACDYCAPNWMPLNNSCTLQDNLTTYFTDAGNCYAQTGLASDNNPPANQTYYCDYCTPNIISNTTACMITDNYTKYYADLNNCYAQTSLISDKIPGNETYTCDYCTASWLEVNTSCMPDNTKTGYFTDANNCYMQTGLSSDNNTPANNTYWCVYDSMPPSTITHLNSIRGSSWLYWNWTNPNESDFNYNIIYFDGNNILNTTNNYYNATGLMPITQHSIRIETIDNYNNINNSMEADYRTTFDEYEDDNDYMLAKTIPANNTPQTHAFDYSNDHDYIKFSAVKDANYYIETENITDSNYTDTIITLYDTDGTTEITINDDINATNKNSRIAWNAPLDGTYYVKADEVFGNANGIYKIKIYATGVLQPYIIIPNQSALVNQSKNLTVKTGVICVGGPCKNVVATLDPEFQGEEKLNGKITSKDLAKHVKEKPRMVIIVFKDDTTEKTMPDKMKFVRNNQDNMIGKLNSDGLNFKTKYKYSVVNAMAGEVNEKALQRLLQDDNVDAIYEDFVGHASLPQARRTLNINNVNTIQVNGKNLTGKGYSVCILDSGIRYTHIALGNGSFPNAKVVGGYDFVNSDGDPWDDYGHGTKISGLAAANANGGVLGIAHEATIVAVKILNSTGWYLGTNAYAGMDWCLKNKDNYSISAVSMSFGDAIEHNSTNCPTYFNIPLRDLNKAGIMNIAASGNEWFNKGQAYPACSPYAIGVGAMDDGRAVNNTITNFTNLGLGTKFLLAPGRWVTTTAYYNDGAYESCTGTSCATPLISGGVTLVNQYLREKYNRTIDNPKMFELLNSTGRQIPPESFSRYNGTFTLPDFYEALNRFEKPQTKGAVSTVVGTKPFYTKNQNPQNCGNMSAGQSCENTWNVTATGIIGTYEFFTIYSSDYGNKNTDKFNVTII